MFFFPLQDSLDAHRARQLSGDPACGRRHMMMTRFARAGRALVYASAVGFVVLGSLPVGVNMTRVLEDRFPTPPADIPAPAGIIVLGGAVNEIVTRYRGRLNLPAQATG